MNKNRFHSFSDPEHPDDQSGDFEYWEERDEKQYGDIWNRDEWNTDEHLTPPHGIYRHYRPRRKNARPFQRRAPITQPSLRRIPNVPPTPRRSHNQSLSYSAQNTQPSMNDSSNYSPSSHGRTKFHFPGGRRGFALLVGFVLLLLGIYLPLRINSSTYTSMATNSTLVEQVCIVHAQRFDNHISTTPYDHEQNLSSKNRVKFPNYTDKLDIHLETVQFSWPLNKLGISNGYKLLGNGATSIESNDWLNSIAPNWPVFSWLVHASSVTVSQDLSANSPYRKLYNLIITGNVASLKPAPLTSGSC